MSQLYLFGFLTEFVVATFWSCWSAALLSGGESVSKTALMLSSLFIAQSIFEVPTGLLADKVGRKFCTLAGLFGLALGFVILSLRSGDTVGLIGFFVCGLGITLMSGARIAWLLACHDELAPQSNAAFKGFFSTLNLLGRFATILGAILGILVIERAPSLFWIGNALIAVSTLIFGAIFLHQSPSRVDFTMSSNVAESTCRNSGFVKGAYLVAGLSVLFFGIEQATRNIVFSPYLIAVGAGDYRFIAYGQIALAVTRILGILFLNAMIGKVAARFHKLFFLAPLFLFGTAEFIASCTDNFFIFMAAYVFAVFTLGWFFPMRDEYINSIIPEHKRATLLSIDSMLLNLGSAAMLIVLSVQKVENTSLLWRTGAVALAMSGVLLMMSYFYRGRVVARILERVARSSF